jgi:ABC-type antimicrobial peptide transport system permease subunit
MVLREGLRLALIGVVVGVAAALALSRFLEGLLFGVAPSDPISFAVAPTVLLLMTLAASAIPAWRATRVDPGGTLRASA